MSLLTLQLEHLGFLDRFETTGLDAFNLLQTPKDSSDIVIVGITDDNYKTLFSETSPLSCQKLKEILDAIAAGNPLVIGVDLDTSSESFNSCIVPGERWPPVVWAADATWDEERKTFTEIPVLGGLGPPRVQDSRGIALFPQDFDGVIRRYHRELPTTVGETTRSFAWAVVEAGCKGDCQNCCLAAEVTEHSHEGLRLNFSGERFKFQPLSVQDVLDAVAVSGNDSVWGTHGLLTKKIVLLGGYYRQARDMHVTPIGPMNGVQINAQAIESELHGGGIRAVNWWLEFGFDVFVGYVLVFINYALRSNLGAALALSLLLIPALCLGASHLAFSAFSWWFNFVPIVVSVMIHEFYEHAREYQRLAQAHQSSRQETTSTLPVE